MQAGRIPVRLGLGERGTRMSRIPTNEEKQVFSELLRYASDCIKFYERVSLLPNCNDCWWTNKGCMCLPEWGTDVRFNCPHWRDPKEEE